MKAVIQRVKNAKVRVGRKVVGQISKGMVILLGIAKGDTKKDADWLINKLINLRIFDDKKGKMNKSLLDIKGGLLIVSQFTLLANCLKGRRPSFDKAASSDKARLLYNYFIDRAEEKGFGVSTGKFGKLMQVELVNDGPVTFVIDTS